MKLITSLVVLGTVAAVASAQGVPPKPLKPVRSSFTELIAYNYAGYTPQQLWQMRNVEHNVNFDSYMRCFSDAWRQNGAEQQYNGYCSSSEVHWNAAQVPQCTSNSFSNVDIPSYIRQFWAAYDSYTVYQGIVEDPYYVTGVRFHRAKHSTQNRWIWYRVNDTALVYEQYYDGTQQSYIKLFPGGIVENPWLYTRDFRIPKCQNPYLALPTNPAPFKASVFSLQEVFDPQPMPPPEPMLADPEPMPATPEPYYYNATKYNGTYGYNRTNNTNGYNNTNNTNGYNNTNNSYGYNETYEHNNNYDYNTYPAENTPQYYGDAINEAKTQFKEYTKWVMENYDTNKDGFLDEKETKRLLEDAMKTAVNLDDVEVWLKRYDTNNDGRLSIQEVADALEEI